MLRIRNPSFPRRRESSLSTSRIRVKIPACAGMTILWLWAFPAFALNSVTVMTDSTMSVAMAEIARDYSRTHQIVVNTSFANSLDQEKQITEGGAADIVITPKQQWIEQLKTQGLVDVHSQVPVAHDRLALVGPADSAFTAKLSKGFPTAALIRQMEGEQAFIVGNPETRSAGIYGKEALRNMGAAGDLEPYTLYIKSLEQMFTMVKKEHAYGIFLYSSVIGEDGVRVIDLFPKSTYQPIVYYAVVIAGENMNEARQFLEYMQSPQARLILRKHGFES